MALTTASVLVATSTGLAFSRVADVPGRAEKQNAAVSLGDSFISGEGGRWAGNASPTNLEGDRWGTDRAAYECWWDGAWCYHDPHRVYGESFDNECDRSDTAEIHSAILPVETRINLACSGAETHHIYPVSEGGKPHKGEDPQADQLRRVAVDHDVKFVVLSIGGNDLGFSKTIEACVKEYLGIPFAKYRKEGTHTFTPCHTQQDPILKKKLEEARPKVSKAIDAIRAAMSSAGYADDSYRFILQSYPSPVARASENRYPENYGVPGDGREWPGGCPMYNDDLDWANDTVVPSIADMLQQVAADRKVEFLDVRDAFKGHALCNKSVNQATKANSVNNPLSSDKAEWGRFLVVSDTFSQGNKRESFHPNAFGQRALGHCLSLAASQEQNSHHVCRGVANKGIEAMRLESGKPTT